MVRTAPEGIIAQLPEDIRKYAQEYRGGTK
jgi:hypothetical protein